MEMMILKKICSSLENNIKNNLMYPMSCRYGKGVSVGT